MRHPDGNQQLLNQLRMHFDVPPAHAALNSSEPAAAFKSFIYLTQVPSPWVGWVTPSERTYEEL